LSAELAMILLESLRVVFAGAATKLSTNSFQVKALTEIAKSNRADIRDSFLIKYFMLKQRME
jgi:hypothetical protein